MNILITGASGYTGQNVAVRLQELGHTLVLLIRRSSTLNFEPLPSTHIFVYEHNIEDLINIFRKYKINLVIHIASISISQHTYEDIDRLIDSNIRLGMHLLDAMKESGCSNMINTSTHWQHYNNKPYSATCLYAATKEAFEKIIDYYVEAYNMKAISLELYDSYGPNDHRKKLLNFIKNNIDKRIEMTYGEQSIDLVHISDVVNAFIRTIDILNTMEAEHKKYMVSAGSPITIKKLVKIIESALGKDLDVAFINPYREREVMMPYNGGTQLPGWTPEYTVEAGIKDLFVRNI